MAQPEVREKRREEIAEQRAAGTSDLASRGTEIATALASRKPVGVEVEYPLTNKTIVTTKRSTRATEGQPGSSAENR